MFDASVGKESVARQTCTPHVRSTDLPTFRMYWVTSRVEQTIVQLTDRLASPLGTDQGRNHALELASIAVSTAEKRTTWNQPDILVTSAEAGRQTIAGRTVRGGSLGGV